MHCQQTFKITKLKIVIVKFIINSARNMSRDYHIDLSYSYWGDGNLNIDNSIVFLLKVLFDWLAFNFPIQ